MTIIFNICSLCILFNNASYNVAAAVSQQNEIDNLDSVVFNDDLTNTLPILSNYIIDEQPEIDSNLNFRDDSSKNIFKEFELSLYDENLQRKIALYQIYDLDSIDLCVPKEMESSINNLTNDTTNKPEETLCKTDINHQEQMKNYYYNDFDDRFCNLVLSFNQDTNDKYMSKNMLQKNQEILETQNMNNIDNVFSKTNEMNTNSDISLFKNQQSKNYFSDVFENHSDKTLTNENIQSTVNSSNKYLYLLQNCHTNNSKKLNNSQHIQRNDNEQILQNKWNCDELLHIPQHSEPPISQSEPRFLELVNFINSNQGEHDFQNSYLNFLLHNTINPCTNQQYKKVNSVKIVENGLSTGIYFENTGGNCANYNRLNKWNDEYKKFIVNQKRKSKHKRKVQEKHSQTFSNEVLVENEQNSAHCWKHIKTHNPQTNLPILHNSYFQPEGLKFKPNKNQETSNNLVREILKRHVLNKKKPKLNTHDDINRSDQRQHSRLDEILNKEGASLIYEEIKQNFRVVKDNSNNLLNIAVDTNENQIYMVDDIIEAHNNIIFTRKEPTDENTNTTINDISDHINKKTFISKNTKCKIFDAQRNQDLNLIANNPVHNKLTLNAEKYYTEQKRTSVALSSRKKQKKTISKKGLQFKKDSKKCSKNSKNKCKNNNDGILKKCKVKEKKTRNNHTKKNKFIELCLFDDVFIDNLNNVTTIYNKLESSILYCVRTNNWLTCKCNHNNQTQQDILIIKERFTLETNFFEKNINSFLSTINKLISEIYEIYLYFKKLTINIVHTEKLQDDSVNFEDKIESLYFSLQNSSDLNMKIVDLTFFRKDNFNFTNIHANKKLYISEILESIARFNEEFKEKNESFYNFIALDESEFFDSRIQIQNTIGILENNKIKKKFKNLELIKKLIKRIQKYKKKYKNRTFDVMQDLLRVRLRVLCKNYFILCKHKKDNTPKEIVYSKILTIKKSLDYVILCVDSLYLYKISNAKPYIFKKFILIYNSLYKNRNKLFILLRKNRVNKNQDKNNFNIFVCNLYVEIYKFLQIYQYFLSRYLNLSNLKF